MAALHVAEHEPDLLAELLHQHQVHLVAVEARQVAPVLAAQLLGVLEQVLLAEFLQFLVVGELAVLLHILRVDQFELLGLLELVEQ